MSKPAVKPVPDNINSLTPHIVCADAYKAMDFYKKAFNAIEDRRAAGPDGKLMHGALRIGNSMLMLTEENPAWGNLGPKSLKGTPVTIHMMVENVDEIVAQAVAAGATLVMPVADMFWGDRYGQVVDPFGHRWSIATHIKDMTPQEMQEAMKQAFASQAECGK